MASFSHACPSLGYPVNGVSCIYKPGSVLGGLAAACCARPRGAASPSARAGGNANRIMLCNLINGAGVTRGQGRCGEIFRPTRKTLGVCNLAGTSSSIV